MKIGLLLRKRREELGLKQKDVAKAVGKSSAYLNKVEKGETTPAAMFLESISLPLQMDFIDLYLQSLEEKDLPAALMDEFRSYRTLRPLLARGMPMERFYSLTKNLDSEDLQRVLLIIESITLMINKQHGSREEITDNPKEGF